MNYSHSVQHCHHSFTKTQKTNLIDVFCFLRLKCEIITKYHAQIIKKLYANFG